MKTIGTLFLFLLSWSISAQTLTNDKFHSRLGFSVSHLTVSDVEGIFSNWEAKATFSKEDMSDLKFEVSADVASINTAVEARDNHLKSADFFDVAKHPKLTFVSKNVQKVKGNKYKVTGDLSLHGQTKPVTLEVNYNGKILNPQNNSTVHGFTVKGSINRLDYGVGPNFPSAIIGEEVHIKANMEFATK